MSERTARQIGLRALAEVAGDYTSSISARVAAAQALLLTEGAPRGWHRVSLRDLTVFFLKCVIGVTPAVMLATILYVGFIIFNSVATQVLGGF